MLVATKMVDRVATPIYHHSNFSIQGIEDVLRNPLSTVYCRLWAVHCRLTRLTCRSAAEPAVALAAAPVEEHPGQESSAVAEASSLLL